MWGCLISQFCGSPTYYKLEPKFWRRRVVALGANAVLLFLLVNLPHAYHLVPRFRTESTVAFVSAGLVFLASFDAGYILPVTRRLQMTLAWIGSRSYGIYLIHIPLFGYIQDIGFRTAHFFHQDAFEVRYRVIYVLTAIVLLPILAELNFRLVESPLRRKGKKIAGKIVAKAAYATEASPTMPTNVQKAIVSSSDASHSRVAHA
jgi:peptidoglycan/LPS O-acetylase OafA/YrhL